MLELKLIHVSKRGYRSCCVYPMAVVCFVRPQFLTTQKLFYSNGTDIYVWHSAREICKGMGTKCWSENDGLHSDDETLAQVMRGLLKPVGMWKCTQGSLIYSSLLQIDQLLPLKMPPFLITYLRVNGVPQGQNYSLSLSSCFLTRIHYFMPVNCLTQRTINDNLLF